MNGPTLHEPPTPAASWRIALPHTAAAVPVARALVRTALADSTHPADSDTAELLTAELVANAVEHTAGDGPDRAGRGAAADRLPGRGARPRPGPAGRPARSPARATSPTPGRSTAAACC